MATQYRLKINSGDMVLIRLSTLNYKIEMRPTKPRIGFGTLGLRDQNTKE